MTPSTVGMPGAFGPASETATATRLMSESGGPAGAGAAEMDAEGRRARVGAPAQSGADRRPLASAYTYDNCAEPGE
jgi:hypothetical protein